MMPHFKLSAACGGTKPFFNYQKHNLDPINQKLSKYGSL